MSRLTEIRGALQLQAASVAGFPPLSQRAYEGKSFDSTVGTPWARLTLMTTSGRPFDLAGESRIDSGLFQISLFYPDGNGTGEVEALADAVMAAFRPGQNLIQGSTLVSIMYAQPGPTLQEPDWIHVVVTIAWRCKAAA